MPTTKTPKLATGHAHHLAPDDAAALRAAIFADHELAAVEVIAGEAGYNVVDARSGVPLERPAARPSIASPSSPRDIVQYALGAGADVLVWPRSTMQRWAFLGGGETVEDEHKLTSRLDGLVAGTDLLVAVYSRFTPEGTLHVS